MGLIKEGSDEAKPIEDQLAVCRAAMKAGIHVSIDKCEDILNIILRVTRNEYIYSLIFLTLETTLRMVASTCTTSVSATRIHPVGCLGLQI
jgi:hypothetical protein